MQLLATADLMRGFDRGAIVAAGIPGLILMENAGRAFVDELERSAGPLRRKKTVVVCGKGNNGGDGFVIARHIANRGGEVVVLLLAGRKSVAGDARTNLESVIRMSRLPGSGVRFRKATARKDFPPRGSAEIVVDAIFGTGFTGNVTGIQLEAISWINATDAYVASVDMPSGVDATTGSVENAAVDADLTVAMGQAKVGHYAGEGADRSGEVRIADIGIPPSLMTPGRDPVFRVREGDASAILPSRPRTANKYTTGKVLVIAGSRSFTGAAVMTSHAALRSGAGAVVLAFPSSLHAVLSKRLTEVIMAPLPETTGGALSLSSLGALTERAAWADAIALGPGLSRDGETMSFVREFLATVPRPVVVDADALFALKSHTAILRKRKFPTILTPHTGEFASLTGGDAGEADRLRVSAAQNAARDLRSILVLKGAPTVTATPRGTAFVNSTGNPGMATIGSGDILTGLVAGLLAQGAAPEAAAYGGVFVHGLAGDLAAARVGMRSILASDIGEYIPAALARLDASR